MRRVGIDTGGTFTDIIVYDESTREIIGRKVLSTPNRPSSDAIEFLAQMKQRVQSVCYGTTIVTNAIVEGRLANTAFITTRNFRDILEIGRQKRGDLYRLDVLPKPIAIVPRELCLEVSERVLADGSVKLPLSPGEIEHVASLLENLGVEAVAICLLNSYANATHEVRLQEALSRKFRYVCPSTEINREYKEYERAVTTVLNAALMPIVESYLVELEGAIERCGIDAKLGILQSNGGMTSVGNCRRRPLTMTVSGPAGGVAASVHLAKGLGYRNAITLDMGGTTSDVCLIANGEPQTLSERQIAGQPVRLHSLSVETVGAGGGSVVWLDSARTLKVGPSSAGATPGPACYGLGGRIPTVTDAHMIIGTLRDGMALGDSIALNRSASVEALQPIAHELQMPLNAVAAGVLEIANATMQRAIRLISVQKGYDLRKFALIAYGGAGPLHAGALAKRLHISGVIVPAYAGLFSALGCAQTDVIEYAVQTFRVPMDRLFEADAEEVFRKLENEVLQRLRQYGVASNNLTLQRTVDLRYVGQNYEIEAPLKADYLAQRTCFLDLHKRLYAYATDGPIECVNVRVTGRIESPKLQLPKAPAMRSGKPVAMQEVSLSGKECMEFAVYRRNDLAPDQEIWSPCIIEDPWATMIVYPGQHARMDDHGNMLIFNGMLEGLQ